jgi:uncharacterized protein YndB with AHSA1/START domain
MKDFDWTAFKKRIVIESDKQTLYNAWTKSSELEKWFLAKALYIDDKGETVSPSECALANSKYDWKWFAQDYHEDGTLLRANGKDFIEFTFANSIVQVQLIENGDEVMVELTQMNIPTDDDSKKNIRLGCDQGWSLYLLNLKSIYEGGIDLRNKDSRMIGVVNN